MKINIVHVLIIFVGLLAGNIQAEAFRFSDLLFTPDQVGQRLFKKGEYIEAAKRFSDPLRRSVALSQGENLRRQQSGFLQN